jgi:signal transduction histidine kinase/CheY-like chemotaxis protein/HPt (histidine-containing phosphotransfer) domain-containing protein
MAGNKTISRNITQLTMVVSSLAVLIAAMMGIWQQYEAAKKQMDTQLTILAQATAFNVASPSMFGDDQEAHEALKVLQVDPEVISARLVLPNKQVFAEYHRKNAEGIYVEGKGDKEIAVDVMWKEEVVGRLYMEVNSSGLLAQLKHQILFALMTVLLALTVAGLLSNRFVRILIRPLRDLNELAQSVGENGDYSMRARETETRDEVGLLTHRFNSMLDRIENQAGELRKQQELLEQRVEERTLQLREQTQRAEAASRAKSEFLAVMSHEIRTPLNGILGMTNMLIDSPLDAKQKRFARVARSSGEDLLAIINDILDFSKIEAGRLELEPRPFQLNGLLEDLAERYAPIAQGKGLELLCSTPIPPLTVEGDSARLAQVLTNLLSNAIKFTSHGEVMLAVKRLEETADSVSLDFSVRDTGIGIAPDQHTKLFTAFTQADTSMSRKYGGTGLGLAISQRLIKLMGGEILLDSKPGDGSHFHFSITLPKVGEVRNYQLAKGFENIRILVVDDNQTNREILEYWLCSWGAQAVMAESAPQALALLQKAANDGKPYELLLTDWMMPDMDGGELIDAIHNDPRLIDLSIVVLSSAGMDTRPNFTTKTVYLLKPVRQSELHNLIASILAGDLFKNQPPSNIQAIDQAAKETWLPKLKGKILLAEDNLVNQEVAMAMLQRIGLQAKIANNGVEVIKYLAEDIFDLVLMDCHMPIMDGFEATQKIREREMTLALTKLPIIALTANAIIGDREHCLAKGMDDYLSKPFTLEQLHKILSQWLPKNISGNDGPDPSSINIDSNVIAQLKSLKVGLLRRVIDLYIETSPKLLSDMEQAVIQQDTQSLYRIAHSLKNSSANLGIVDLTNLCRELEVKGRAGELVEATLLVTRIKNLFSAVEVALLAIKNEGEE